MCVLYVYAKINLMKNLEVYIERTMVQIYMLKTRNHLTITANSKGHFPTSSRTLRVVSSRIASSCFSASMHPLCTCLLVEH
jgi:hypothetical protein